MKAAGHLRVDARLDRARRGRPDPPAGRAPGRAAGDPRPGRGPAGRRERDRGRLAHGPRAHRPAGRAVPDPAERADVRPLAEPTASARPRARPAAATCWPTRRDGNAAGDPDRPPGREVQLAVEAREALEAEGIAHPGGLDAVRRVVRRAGRGLPRRGAATGGQGAGRGRGRGRAGLARTSSATPARSSASSTSARPRAYTDAVRAVRHHRRPRRRPPAHRQLAADWRIPDGGQRPAASP